MLQRSRGETTMADENPSCLSHVSVGVRDLAAARSFYDPVLSTIGLKVILDEPGFGTGYGKIWPEFWINLPFDGAAASPGNGVHIALLAPDAAAVDAFHAQALALGGRCDGPPGLRPQYLPNYYAAFVRDPDGNKIEAMVLT
jgi:catechol 2,3-dioxygenase-like lactoylglutathione lyase family enzyme